MTDKRLFKCKFCDFEVPAIPTTSRTTTGEVVYGVVALETHVWHKHPGALDVIKKRLDREFREWRGGD